MTLGTILAAAKGLSWLSWLIPGRGLVKGLLSALGAFIGYLGQGLVAVFRTPGGVGVLVIVGLTAFAAGLYWGAAEGARRVAAMEQEIESANETAKERLAKALEARKAAEEQAAKAESSARHYRRRATNKRVRGDADYSGGLCLPGFSDVLSWCKPSGQ